MYKSIETPLKRGAEWREWTEYVYLWITYSENVVFAKVGITNNPRRRFCQFRTSCPLPVGPAYLCQVPTREVARDVERKILHAFRGFKARGEWIKIPFHDDLRFVAACSKLSRNVSEQDCAFRPLEFDTRF